MTKYEMTAVEAILEKDETLEWVGSPEEFGLMDAPYNKQVTGKMITGAVIAVIAAAISVLYQINYHNITFAGVLALVGIFVAVMVGFQPIFDRKNMLNKHFYVVTNRRVVFAKSDAKGDYIEMPYNENTSVVVVEGNGGKGSVCIGEGVKSVEVEKLRSLAVKPKTVNKDGVDVVTGIVFYNVPDPKQVKKVMGK